MLSPRDEEYIEKKLGRKLTALEYACFENLWSEHCSYRSTKPLLRTLPTDGENVLLGPGDDAAIVKFSDDIALSIGMESHNHPSYVDPYDGAATGVGGIVRDIISMGSRPIALMDPLFFGEISDEKNRYIFEHVVAGIGDYGNCIGVPVVRGDLVFDKKYAGNPLVNVVCVGIVHPDKFLTARVKEPGSRLILYGSSTGRDGLGGASFASRDLSEDSEAEDRPAVQVGDPYTEKLLIEATLELAETGKVLSCRDLGAAGLAGASSEMSETFGARLYADRVHLREENMNEVEIFLAESQERMLVEVRPEDVAEITSIIEKYDLKWSDIGEVTEEKKYVISFNGEIVCDLPIDLLVGGAPEETWSGSSYNVTKDYTKPRAPLKELCLKVLSHPEIAKKDWVSRQYDHDVQLRSVSVGGGAACLKLGDAGLYLSCGCSPRQIFLKPYEGTANAVYENAANLAAMGAEPLCIVNCLNFASPVHDDVFWQISESVRGMGDMCRSLGVPVVGGNVSLYNESDEFGTQIPPTPCIGMVGKGNVRIYTPASAGQKLALIGKCESGMGGSLLDEITGCDGEAPAIPDTSVLGLVRSLVNTGKVSSATDISHGGLLAAVVSFAGTADLNLSGDPVGTLFSESYGRFLVAVDDEKTLEGIEYEIIGTAGGDVLKIRFGNEELVLEKDDIESALESTTKIMRY